ncbi:GlsB/YeaQ/YmgE family stress response membrane protein [Uliginosibacterium sp. H1]|uniref:GlsB/YeaQ/YmgE family stress response membrane protein n=1 Tax=Uliginosibacterium sp. H1 TaxID=3114757 RepID=UPI002E1876C3|nr:GlsB/YeaQ/YmgE family stress response membrane protein [Uliginosibacterium sp. H1]
MSLLVWIALGVVAGIIVSTLLDGSAQGLLIDVLVGIAGAIAGGLIYATFGVPGVETISNNTLITGIVGAGVLLLGYRGVRHAIA